MSTPRVLLAWSSGKDSAWALHILQHQPGVEVAGLFTTVDESTGLVPIHGIRQTLVEAQAAAVALPLYTVPLPTPCPNTIYEARVRSALCEAAAQGVTHVAFGDLFLADIRTYREQLVDGTGLTPLFPLWTTPTATAALARQMLAEGLQAVVACVDTDRLDPALAGRPYDAAFLADLPKTVDPCGERGAFHTFCTHAPSWIHPVPVQVGPASQVGARFHTVALGPAEPA
ncbi:MAG: ATP-binding protein [Bacteroidota bacterium]